jgi:hypothetical protein
MIRSTGVGFSDLFRGPDAPLADLEEAAAVSEDGKALVDELVGERVEDDVDTRTVRVGDDLVSKVECSRAVDVTDPERLEMTAFTRSPGCSPASRSRP